MADTARRARAVAIARALLAEGKTPTAEAIATAAGISRATYYRVVGGSHQALLREAGYISEPPARERVLTAATALLTEVGLSGLHMDAVAEHAGVSRPTLYRLFPGKADLLAAVTHRHAPFRGLGGALAAIADQPPEAVLSSLVTLAVPRLLPARGLVRAVLAEATMSGPDTSAGRQAVAGAFAALVSYVEGQIAAGRLRRMDPLVAVQGLLGPLLLIAVAQPDFWTEVTSKAPPAPAQTVADLVQLWLRGMRPEPGEEAGPAPAAGASSEARASSEVVAPDA